MQFDTRRVEKVHERCSNSSGLWLGAARTIAELAIHQSDSENNLRKLDEIEAEQQRQHGR